MACCVCRIQPWTLDVTVTFQWKQYNEQCRQKLNCMYSGSFFPPDLPEMTLLHDPEVLLLIFFSSFFFHPSSLSIICTSPSYCVGNLTWLFQEHPKNCCCDYAHDSSQDSYSQYACTQNLIYYHHNHIVCCFSFTVSPRR